MRKFIFITSIFFLSCSSSEDNYNIEYYSYPNKKSEGLVKSNLREGVWKFYFPDGNINSIITYSHGKMNGETKVYFQNGNLLSTAFLINGNFIGLVKNYYPNGNLSSIEYYDSNSITQDTFKIWYKSGKLKQIGKYADGMVVGKCILFYENQNIKEVRYYDSLGRKDSIWLYYSPSSELLKKENYIADSVLNVENE